MAIPTVGYGVNAAKGLPTASGSMHSRMIDADEYNSTVRWLHDTYEFDGEIEQSTINLGRIPDDSWIINGVLYFDALGSGTELSVGSDTDPELFQVATSTSTQGSFNFILTPVASAFNVIVTVVSGTRPVTGSIELSMLYVV